MRLALLACLAGSALPADAAAPPGQWWNAGFTKRQKLNLTAGATAIPTQYSVRLQIDHASLVSLGQSLASGNDVRIAWWSGTAWVELDRLLDDESSWNNAATRVWFRTQAAIGASATDDNYYLYYGSPGAGAPPANWANVFLLHDDFNDGVFDNTTRWDCTDPFNFTPPPVCAESAGTLTIADDSALSSKTGLAFGQNTRWESRLRLATDFAPTFAYNYMGASDLVSGGNPYTQEWITFWCDTTQHWVETADLVTSSKVAPSPAIVTPTAFHVYTFDREGGASVRFFQDAVQVSNKTTNVPGGNLRLFIFNDDTLANGIVLDWVRVRRYVTPEPTFTTNTSESWPVGMRVLSGSYTGNGVDNRPIFVGFTPDVVFVDRNDPANPGSNKQSVVRTSSMIGDLSKSYDDGDLFGIALVPNMIQSLDPQGFTVGTHVNVNQNGITYYWVAFTGAPGELKVGSYTGTPAAQDITTVGFSPAYVLVIPAAAQNAVQKTSVMPTNFSQDFVASGYTNAILNLRPDGFRVGTSALANQNGQTFHYAAWGAVPGKVAVGSYTGGAPADNRNITGTGFWPEWVMVLRSSNAAGSQTSAPVHKPASTGVGLDIATLFDVTLTESNNIQNLSANGFQVGSHVRVNSAAAPNTFHWVAFGPHSPTTYYRSIGNTAVTYGTAGTTGAGTRVSVTNGSATVGGLLGTTWRASNRGRGDVITIPCDDPPACTLPTPGVHYMILSLTADSSLQLSQVYQGPTNASASYVIRRQFSTLPSWEDCISGFTPACNGYFPVTGGDLVTEDRSEVGIAYKDSVFTAGVNVNVSIDGSTTDALHTITLTADPGNRHNGIPGTGVILDGGVATDSAVLVLDDFVTVEWLEIRNGGSGFDGVEWQSIAAVNKGIARNLLIHGLPDNGIQIEDSSAIVDIYNNIVYQNGGGFRNVTALGTGSLRIFNNTFYGNGSAGGVTGNVVTPNLITLRNNIAHSNAGVGDYNIPNPNAASSNNISSDATATSVNPGGDNPLWNSVPLAAMSFVSSGTGNLHILGTSRAVDAGVDLSAVFPRDIDGVLRLLPWEIGADDVSPPTAVELLSFAAAPADGAVDLTWTTASELHNLGFHLYRADAPDGPYARLTSLVVPGLGSSPTGASYAWRDGGLVNGRTYYYELEDIETTGATERHGPISATPSRDGSGPVGGGGGTAEGTAYGDPSSWSLRELERSSRHVVLELRTGGFRAVPQGDGTVQIEVPGFEESPATGLPVKRALVPAVAGRQVRLVSVVASEETSHAGLVPAGPRIAEMASTADGVVEPTTRRSRRSPPSAPAAAFGGALFQGEVKKAAVDFSPLRLESGRLVLSGRIVVRLDFSPADPREVALGGPRGRKPVVRPGNRSTGVVGRLAVGAPGLYRIGFDELFPPSLEGRSRRAIPASQLRLSRQGRAVAYHLEPQPAAFGPGSALFFHSAGAELNPYGEAVYELEAGAVKALRMPVATDRTGGAEVAEATSEARFEKNQYYQAGLLEAPDLWLWDILVSPSTGAYPFVLTRVAPSAAPATLVLDLQGASDFEGVPDHHLRFFVNGAWVGETQWDGKTERRVELAVEGGRLHEGENEIQIENVGDAGAAYSMVFLDRFAVRYPRALVAQSGVFEGATATSGRVEVRELGADALAVDSTEAETRWMPVSRTPTGLAFGAEAGRRYWAAAPLRPRVLPPVPSSLKRPENQADYLVIGPQSFLDAAEPLLAHRRSQGLVSRAVSTEEVFQEFGHGESRPEALKAFLEYAYHHWEQPSPRYVLLLGDATYDPKDYLQTGVVNRVPAFTIKTSYLWTVSDPALAAVNGEDLVPDLAIGRLSAASVDEVPVLVEKVLAFEGVGRNLEGAAALVADNPDLAGDFEANANEIASTILAARDPERIFVRERGTATRAAIVGALDGGLSLLSYVGHGATAVWAGENVFNDWDVPTLAPQPRQPLLLTLNCLNGFFHFPPLDSLAEAMVKAEGKGAIAALSPSGLSLDAPAHAFHKAVLREVASGGHQRLGDAVLAAQQAYANEGALLELLSIYHLLGDPALRIR